MKTFDEFLKETNFQRTKMIETATKEIDETIKASTNAVDSSYGARVSLSVFRGEMAIYHQWLMEQIARMDRPATTPQRKNNPTAE